MMTDEELADIKETWRVHTSESWNSLYHERAMRWMVPALLAEVERLRAREAAMREIVEAVGRGDMICAQEDFGTTPICVFGCDGHEDANEIGAFIHTSTCPAMKARAFLATGEGEAKE